MFLKLGATLGGVRQPGGFYAKRINGRANPQKQTIPQNTFVIQQKSGEVQHIDFCFLRFNNALLILPAEYHQPVQLNPPLNFGSAAMQNIHDFMRIEKAPSFKQHKYVLFVNSPFV